MGRLAARQNDRILATDQHLIQPPGPTSPIFVPHQFDGRIDNNLSSNVKINGRPAALRDSTATNTPHIPQGGSFVKQPTNRGTISTGSATVKINKRPAARDGDTAITCNDPMDMPVGKVVVVPGGKPVWIGE